MGNIEATIGAVMALAACCAAECPHWISVMPLPGGGGAAELAANAAELGNTTFIDGIAWSCAIHPEGDPPVDRASFHARRYREVAPLLRALSPVPQGILLQATMGHGGFPGSPAPWQLAVPADGRRTYRMCPMDERFLDYIAGQCRTFAELKPDFFMVDDDTRLIWDGIPGCFCPLHLAEFAKRTGREWTREEAVAMLKADADCAEARIWKELNIDSLRRFFGVIRKNFGTEIPGMYCTVTEADHLRHAGEFARILAAPGQTPVVRGGGAPYHNAGRDLLHIVGMRWSYAAQRALAGDGVIYLQESDTCPHTLWACSATRMFDHLVMLALDGCKGAKIWITRTGSYHEKKSGEAYRRILRENKGLMEWAAKVDLEQHGVVVPICGPGEFNFGDRFFALTGFPYRFGKAGSGEITALTAETLALLSEGEIDEILSGLAILDGPAAVWLSEHGRADDIGVDARPWNGRTIQAHEFSDGSRQPGIRTGGLADLTNARDGARTLTRLLHRDAMGGELVFEAPGSLLYENGRGGRILVLAQPIPAQATSYFSAQFFSEGYKAQMAAWLKALAGEMPGGVNYLGVGPVTCLSGTTKEGEEIVVLNALDLDGDSEPELSFPCVPTKIERLCGDGGWESVAFESAPDGSAVKLRSPVAVQHPAIFRWK